VIIVQGGTAVFQMRRIRYVVIFAKKPFDFIYMTLQVKN